MARLLPPLFITLTALSCVSTAAAQTWRALFPPPRYGHSVCSDPVRGVTWLLGGTANNGVTSLGDLWAYDGTRWIERTPAATGPAARLRAAMVFSISRGRVILFGGTRDEGLTPVPLNDTWEYDGQTWTLRTPATSPSARFDHAMVDDMSRGRVVLFGGHSSWSTQTSLADTWEYDGTDWSLVPATTSPPPCSEPAMACDALRSRTILYDASNGRRTWSYDGSRWTEVFTLHRPATSTRASMWYDFVGARIMLLEPSNGATVNTWAFDGIDWTQLAASPAPSRRGTPVTYDLSRARAVLFGGTSGTADTWEFDGQSWAEIRSAYGGRQLNSTMAAYDPARGCTVLNGTVDPFIGPSLTLELTTSGWQERATATAAPIVYPNDWRDLVYDVRNRRTVLYGAYQAPQTWLYDGVNWSPAAASTSPPWRFNHAIAYDSLRNRVVLFGGRDASVFYGDTWEYDGVRWSQVNGTAPAVRYDHCMAFDAARGTTVMYGGQSYYFPYFSDTWLFDGTWRQVSGANTPGGRIMHNMAFDPTRGQVLLYGGTTASSTSVPGLTDLYGFDGAQWRTIATADAPPPARGAVRFQSLAFDASSGRLLLVGPGTWEFVPAAVPTWNVCGTGCAVGSNPALALAGAQTTGPALGGTFPVALTTPSVQSSLAWLVFGADLGRWNGTPLPIDLDSLGGSACRLWVPANDGVLVLMPGGAATVAMPVPADPRLAGATFGMQAVLVDANATSLFGGISNAIAVRIQ